jgi:uncharacterized protein (TIGR02444 family)
MSGDAPALEHPFWRFSLAVYRDKGVQAECLDVQERLGVDVNLMLFCAYLGAAEGLALGARDLDEAAGHVAAWHEEAVKPLRAARRSLKPWAEAGFAFAGEAGAARKQVQALEIRAEQIEQALLWHWLGARRKSLTSADRDEALRANLDAFLARHGETQDVARVLHNLLRAAIAGATQSG